MELLSGTAHLKRGERNLTEGAKNRARSLTVARYALLCQFPLHPFVKFLYTLTQVPKCHIADNQHLSYFGTPFE